MTYFYAFLGFIALIVLHEAGHFFAAKAVGMRVERFSLFFPPLLLKHRRGETEYAIGALPFGGYVKITGMSPEEDIPPEVLPRAYYNQAVWKRIVVIAAGPAVNIVLAIVIVWILLASGDIGGTVSTKVTAITPRSPAAHVLKVGDTIVAADGVSGSEGAIRDQIESHRCAGGAKVKGCLAATPARLVVRRDGKLQDVSIRPQYTTVAPGVSGMYIGVGFGDIIPDGFWQSGSQSISSLWGVSKETISTFAHIFEAKQRSKLQGVVGVYDETAQSFGFGIGTALEVLALISLSLGIINLFPFLPLDGGHIFWAVAEKVRGRRIPFSVMERAGFVGFILIIALFVIGLSNSISGLTNGTLNLH